MARTFIRQDDQIAASNTADGFYDDTIAPSEANYETNPADLLDDLNSLRSQVQNFLNRDGASFPVGNWFDDLTAPVTLEAGTQRGIDSLNDALHLVEKKRILRDVCSLVDVTVPAGVAATGSITTATQASYTDGQTFQLTDVLGQVVVFEFDTVPNGVGGGNVAVDISGDTTADNVRDSIISAIQGVGATLLITATNGGAATVTLTQDHTGSSGNTTIPTTGGPPGTFTAFTGGVGNEVILGTGELPSQTTAAVGAVTTLGTVVAAHTGTFGNHTLDEVTGPNAVQPKNLMAIVDGSSRDPITDSNEYIVWGLLQSENASDGHTITDTTPNRVQISFVTVTPSGDDLRPVEGAAIAGKTINYCSRERVRLEDLNEADFLRGAIIDTPGAGTTVTRQDVYDNQGTTPVDLTTNATLDLEAAGIEWLIRDDLEASLFGIVEGSAGGTSQVNIYGDVDEFDVDAVVNNFLNGLSIDTGAGSTTINVGVTANSIDTTGALTVQAGTGNLVLDTTGGEVEFDDTYRAASTYSVNMRLADSSQEWSDFETYFGEVSLLSAIGQAYLNSGRRKVVAVATADVTANNDVSGPSDDNNLDVDLGDLSGGTFVTDYDIYLNGVLLRNGANAAANHDVYPGTALANGQLRFEFNIKGSGSKPDQITVIDWVGTTP